MITYSFDEEVGRYSFYGKTKDTKPIEVVKRNGQTVGVTNGSTFFDIDTSTLYIFDAELKQWKEM